jgi:hypothetical protein
MIPSIAPFCALFDSDRTNGVVAAIYLFNVKRQVEIIFVWGFLFVKQVF